MLKGGSYRLDVVISELSNQRTHRHQIIIDALQQHSLITDNNTISKQLLRSLSADPAEFAWVAEMSVNRNLLAHLLALVRQADQLLSPHILRIESSTGRNAEALCSDAETAYVGNCEEAVTDEAQLVGEEVVGITARDDDVLDDGVGGDVGKGLLPAGFNRLVGLLGHGFGVAADGVGTGAVAAVETTD